MTKLDALRAIGLVPLASPFQSCLPKTAGSKWGPRRHLLAAKFNETFPEAGGDPYDFLIPPVTFGAWLKN